MSASEPAAARAAACADVSVIMPAWRAGATIGRALGSIAAQTVAPREVIVVDDGSDDDTVARAEAMAEALRPAELRIFRQPANCGPGAARNRAVAEARAPIVAFLDADDEWLPEKLERSLAALDRYAALLVAHNIVVDDGAGETVFDCARHLPAGTDPFPALFKRGFVSTATVVCRKAAVLAAGGFDETLRSGQDYELWLSMARAMSRDDGGGFVVLPETLTRYHVTPDSVSSRVGLRRRCSIAIARRHAPALKGRARHPLSVLLTRIAIVTVEAARAYARQGNWPAAFAAALGFLPAAGAATIAYRPEKPR